MKSYTLTELEDAYDEYADDDSEQSAAASAFLDWLRRREEIDELLAASEMAEDEVEGQPVDLLGAGGVPGLATREEIDDLMLVRDGIEGCCGGLDDKCCD